ncbi:branched-chain amino acid ABC transporter substrate-binding protein [Hoeflea poritis]|uniref:Branched-chain amino acid ABC transporter substrate-binding protein n=1 Tax=Hoeflea poritis TaxID=2993659 RepID=A0ABT4VW04_9HYPH|nr:branched-chain amino acid ABC transporter substrate-binding protein [Hoeflea poritis]MDA4848212.1 branched-chain amino acid ABC transporter substrate-binding protein [Hoeflea poritis]
MRLARLPLLAALFIAGFHSSVAGAIAEEADNSLRVGVFVPTEGNFAILGEQIINGIKVLKENSGLAIAEVLEEPDTCDVEGGQDAASAFAEAGVDAVIGFLCMESLAAALPILSASDIPSISLGVRSAIIAEDANRSDWLFYRLAPRDDDEAKMITRVISTDWLGKPLALVEDGTIYGRELMESVRLMLEEIGISPIFVDNFRPSQDRQFGLVRRLQKSGATHIFIGGDRQDAATIARDSAEAGLGLVFLGGDALNAAEGEPPLADGFLAVTLPEPRFLPSATRAVKQFDDAEISISGYSIPAYAAGQILLAAKRAAAATQAPLADYLTGREFFTALGSIQFDDFGERRDNPFELMVWHEGTFAPADLSSEVRSGNGEETTQ